ncbi:hypothetical protein JYK14_16935 [Siccirubricoccus sp. KC 17139]|uniref:Heparinase n=1 Tax=Siccirubricoccus soli TaxID=2899147 RepID=A0ABT1D9A2_9PROT|nr:hypothetical protein [Siccirubricoccus soli]MCO6417835.1 hypothetical protein [Siccirubricoccus soli]MCP2683970.1 hypothetical protein [Siccirubricoccus soli]
MSAAPLLAALFRRMAPPPHLLDLGLPEARLFPWLPGALCGVAEAAALPAAERALLAGFRDATSRRPPFGFDAATDAALLAGAPAAWGGEGDRLVCLPGPPPPVLAPLWQGGAWALLRAGQAGWAGADRGRIMLLAGTAEAVEQYDLLLPAARLAEVLDRLEAASAALAAAGGPWRIGCRRISARLGSLTLLREAAGRPGLALAAPALWHDGPQALAGKALPLASPGRLRILLGSLPCGPARLSVRLRGGAPPVLFLGGRRLAATPVPDPDGAMRLEATPELAGGPAEVLGLATLPGPAPALLGLEVTW